jgi:hypothetical protein
VLIGELQIASRLGLAVAAHVVELLAQACTGLPQQGLDLRTQRLDVGLRIGRADLAGRLRDRWKDAVQRGGYDAASIPLLAGRPVCTSRRMRSTRSAGRNVSLTSTDCTPEFNR